MVLNRGMTRASYPWNILHNKFLLPVYIHLRSAHCAGHCTLSRESAEFGKLERKTSTLASGRHGMEDNDASIAYASAHHQFLTSTDSEQRSTSNSMHTSPDTWQALATGCFSKLLTSSLYLPQQVACSWKRCPGLGRVADYCGSYHFEF
jgi:hypothetical protein